ncbi:MAG: cytochrome c1, partial [Burkholderiales bacterium]
PNVAMPHVLWQLQGEQVLATEVQSIPRGTKGEAEKHEVQKLALEKPGAMKPAEYDRLVGDLVNFLVYIGEPFRQSRVELGIYVLMFLGVLFVLAYLLKKEYWKDVH